MPGVARRLSVRQGWQPSRGISGSFAVESVAGLAWNQWQLSRGTGGSLRVESVAALPWNRWQLSRGIRRGAVRVLSQSSIFGQNPKIGCQEFNVLQTPKPTVRSFFSGLRKFQGLGFFALRRSSRLMAKLIADLPAWYQVTEGSAIKLQHRYLSGD